MGEWVRLTPDGSFGNVRSRRDETGAFVTYEIDDSHGVATLTVPEALAFARQLPEVEAREQQVKALVAALEIVYNKQKLGPANPANPETALYRCTFTSAEIDQMDAAFAPFQEASGG